MFQFDLTMWFISRTGNKITIDDICRRKSPYLAGFLVQKKIFADG